MKNSDFINYAREHPDIAKQTIGEMACDLDCEFDEREMVDVMAGFHICTAREWDRAKRKFAERKHERKRRKLFQEIRNAKQDEQ